jgi:hypothetical protein
MNRACLFTAWTIATWLGETWADAQAPEVADGSIALGFGASAAPFALERSRRLTGHALVLTFEAGWRPIESVRVGARVPLVLASVAQPAGSYVDEAAFGNPELSGSYAFDAWSDDDLTLELEGSLALGLPLAEHDAEQIDASALAIGDALHGYAEPTLFTPDVVPVSLAATARLGSERWAASATLRLPVLFRFDDEWPPNTRTRTVGFSPALAIDGLYWFVPWFGAGASAWLVLPLVRVAESAAERVQVSVAPAVVFRIAARLDLRARFLVPLGGPLGGSTYSGALTAAVRF